MPKWISFAERNPKREQGDYCDEILVKEVRNGQKYYSVYPFDHESDCPEKDYWLDDTEDEPDETDDQALPLPIPDGWELVPDGVQIEKGWKYASKSDTKWYPSVGGYVPSSGDTTYIRPKKQTVKEHTNDGWITDRVPEEEDGRRVEDYCGLYVEVTTDTGGLRRVLWDAEGLRSGLYAAWKRLPDPYVPPKKVESEKQESERREFFRVWIDGIFFSDYETLEQAEEAISKHPDGRKLIAEIEHLRTVLPGDPSPEAVQEVADELTRLEHVLRVNAYRVNADWVHALADKLEGKQT